MYTEALFEAAKIIKTTHKNITEKCLSYNKHSDKYATF